MFSIIKRLFILGLYAGGSFCYVDSAYSQIWIEERQRAELPASLISSHRMKIVLTHGNQLGGQTSAEVVGGQIISGHYFISSDTQQMISINLISNQDDADISLTKFTMKYKGQTYKSFPAVGLPSPGNGEDVFIGFTATINQNTSEGERFPSYILDVNEE